jgi:hypothetical protein
LRLKDCERPPYCADAHRFDQKTLRHFRRRPAILPRKLFQPLKDFIVQIADYDLIHDTHRVA